MRNLVAAALCCAPAVVPCAVSAEMKLDYEARQGYDSNIFSGPDMLGSRFSEASLKLRGTLDIDGSTLAYALTQHERRNYAYRFADVHETTAEIGLEIPLADGLKTTLEASLSRNASGDLLAALPELTIGYRTIDYAGKLGARTTLDTGIGKTVLAAQYQRLYKGKATFTTDLLAPARVDNSEGLVTLSLAQAYPALGGQAAINLEYRRSMVSAADQRDFSRFPGEVLRGSLAYGADLGGGFGFLLDAGATALFNREIPDGKLVKPYLRVQTKYQVTEAFGTSIDYTKDFNIYGIDDAVGEFAQGVSISANIDMTPASRLQLAYAVTHSDYAYYLYDTLTRQFSARLTTTLTPLCALSVDYSFTKRHEADADLDYLGRQVAARISGTF